MLLTEPLVLNFLHAGIRPFIRHQKKTLCLAPYTAISILHQLCKQLWWASGGNSRGLRMRQHSIRVTRLVPRAQPVRLAQLHTGFQP